jgi:uncharacterized SAM-binding protein YcdF (DUF218 family)
VAVTQLLNEAGIGNAVLVVDAVSTYRALRCFRKQGVTLTPSPCHFRATSYRVTFLAFIPNAASARNCARVVHEWLGLLWYSLRGRI